MGPNVSLGCPTSGPCAAEAQDSYECAQHKSPKLTYLSFGALQSQLHYEVPK